MAQRWACRLVNQPRGPQRYRPTQREDEDQLPRAIIALAKQYGRYGYRRITALLNRAGWQAGKDRVDRIWRREGLKVPQKQKPCGRLWINDGSCVRLRPAHENHVWSYDFVSVRTHDVQYKLAFAYNPHAMKKWILAALLIIVIGVPTTLIT